MPKVSVVIPTYNRAELLRSAIMSVLNQTFQDFEIIVVDDGSKDNTQEVISNFNDERIEYIRHEKNKGEAGTRNTGIVSSNGDFIAFLDDDDEWLPEKLKMQVDLLENSPHEVGGVYTGFLKVDRTTGKILRKVISTKRGYIYNEMLMYNLIRIPSVILLKKECFEKVGLFDVNIPYGLDYDMWIRISKEFHFEYIKEPLVKYYTHRISRLSTNHGLVVRGLEVLLKKYAQLFASDGKNYSRRYLDLGVHYCYNGNAKKGREAFLKAIRLYPFEIRHYFNFCLSLLGADSFKKLKAIKEKIIAPLRHDEI